MAMSDFQIQTIKIDAESIQRKLNLESEFLLYKLNKVLKKLSEESDKKNKSFK